MRRIYCLCVALSISLWSVQVRANPILEDGAMLGQGYAIELGVVGQTGMGEFSAPAAGISPNAQGIVLKDRHGITSRVMMAVLIVLGGAVSASAPKKVESKTYRSGNYRVTETTTTYRSPAEQQAIMAASAGAAAGIFSVPMAEFELEVFGRDRFGFGDSSGYKLNMLFGSGSELFYVEGGLGWGSVDSLVTKNNVNYKIQQKYFGIPLRIGGAISKLAWTATLEWNWRGTKTEDEKLVMNAAGVPETTVGHHPLRVEAQMGLFGRVYGQAGVVFPTMKKFEYGYKFSAGFRF